MIQILFLIARISIHIEFLQALEIDGCQLRSPLKWIRSDDWSWYFQAESDPNNNQNQTWIEYKQKKRGMTSYSQIFYIIDSDGYPVVTLRNESDAYDLIGLTNGMAYFKKGSRHIGFWDVQHDKCNNLPPKCEYVSYRQTLANIQDGQRHETILCKNDRFDDHTMQEFAKTWQCCPSLMSSTIDFNLKPITTMKIIDSSFGIFNLTNFLPKLGLKINLNFLGYDGFDIDSLISFVNINELKVYTKFNLYKQKRLIAGCEQFENDTSNTTRSTRGFIFRDSNGFISRLSIIKPNSRHPVCSLFFRDVRILKLQIDYLINSYVLRNVLSFVDPASIETIDLDSQLHTLWLSNSYGLDLTTELLNAHIFARTIYYRFDYHVNSIATGVFKTLPNMFEIYFNPADLIRLIRRQGIEWIQAINSAIDIDLMNRVELANNLHLYKGVVLDFSRDLQLATDKSFAYDHDFCLFVHYPFQQLVFIYESGANVIDRQDHSQPNQTTYSCTELWLYRFFVYINSIDPEFFDYLKKQFASIDSTACQFERRLELCNKTRFATTTKSRSDRNKTAHVEFSSFDFVMVAELTLMVLLVPVLAAYALVTNLLAIWVIYHKTNKKTMREKHYVYMSLHSAANALISLIQLTSLVSECQYPFGLFCSSIRHLIAIQYLKIVVGEGVNHAGRLVANFAYFGFTMCRMAKVGKDHGKFVSFMNDLRVLYFMGVSVLVSIGLSVCKSLQFNVNVDMPEYAYPVPFVQNSNDQWTSSGSHVAVLVLNAVVYDFVNYFVFVLVHFVVDLVLVKKLWAALREKEDKLREMKSSQASLDKTMIENQESRRRIVLMVVVSSVFGLLTKVPSMITSLNDLRLVFKPFNENFDFWFNFDPKNTSFSFEYFCSSEKGCLVFQQVGNCLFMVSLCSTLHFLKLYDTNFKTAYDQLFRTSSK